MAGPNRRDNAGRRQYDDDEEEPHVYCFVPGEGIDVVVLAQYLKRWVDGTATIQASKHPKDPERIGYTVGACSTLNREALEDLLNDTRQWQKEQSSREFRRNPYDYVESDTFQDRKKRGPTPGSTVLKLAKPRKAATTDAPAGRGAAAVGRHDVDKADNPPPYPSYARNERDNQQRDNQQRDNQQRDNQQRDNQQRGRGADNQRGNNSPSSSPSPPRRPQPDPDSFRNLSITDDQNRPNPGAPVQRATAGTGGRHAATTTGTTKYVLKTPGNNAGTGNNNNNDPPKKVGRHDENWH